MTARNAPAEPAITNQTTPGAAVASLAGLVAAVVVAVGTAGCDRAHQLVLHPGAVVLAVAAVKLWRERP